MARPGLSGTASNHKTPASREGHIIVQTVPQHKCCLRSLTPIA